MTQVAALVFLVLATIAAIFQVAVAAGAPWGGLTQGGRFAGTLPRPMRIVALVSAVLLVAFAAIVAARASLINPPWVSVSRSLSWVVVAYCAVGVLANAATPSRQERRLWLPIVVLMLASSAVVAMS